MNSANDKAPAALVDASRPGTAASLTYELFYGLREKPFSLSAEPRFLFRSPAHGLAFDELQAGIRRREGLIVLTGEIGTGKTTLCRSVLQHLDRRTFASFVADPFVSREDLLKTLLVDFGVISIGDLTRGRFNGASRSDLSYPLYEFLDSLVPLQAFAVVVVDEAQNLSLPLLEEIRILSELERREKLLQVVLVGQPELRSSLRLPEMRQVDQRVSVRCDLTALDAGGVAGYVNHRLGVASRGKSRVEFTMPALEAVYDGSSGVPRLINRICDRALQRAYVARTLQIDAPFVWSAIEDLGLSMADGIQDPPSRRVAPGRAAAISEAPTQPPVEIPRPTNDTQSEAAVPIGLAEFPAESDVSVFHRGSIARSGRGRSWVAAAAAIVLTVSASAGAAGWYARAQSVEGQAVTALVPPPPTGAFSQPVTTPPRVELLAPQAPSAVPPAQTSSTVGAAAAVPAARGGYSILVASFERRDRAERLVEELTTAGYRARAVNLDGDATRGRLTLVRVSGYTSALDVQRDLQRIHELPGGYSDARIVEPH